MNWFFLNCYRYAMNVHISAGSRAGKEIERENKKEVERNVLSSPLRIYFPRCADFPFEKFA